MIDAIAIAKGEYIAVQGSGDISEPTRIVEQAKILDENPEIGVVGCYYENIVEDLNLTRLRQPVADDSTLESLRRRNVFSHGEVMYRRIAYEMAGGYRTAFKFCQDYDLWLRMIRDWKFFTVKQRLYRRYIQFEGVTYSPEKAIIQARYAILCQRMAEMSETEANCTYAALKEKGPLAIIPLADATLQRHIFYSCLRSIVWGDASSAIAHSENLESPRQRKFVLILSRFISNAPTAILRKLLYRGLGIKIRQPHSKILSDTQASN